jgi:hypothetical protein
MRVDGHGQYFGRGSDLLSAAAPRAIEKASTASRLKREHGDTPRKRHKTEMPHRAEPVCQAGTMVFDPFRDAPKLWPAFVAQVLGQVMAASRARPSPSSAYGRAADAGGRLIDRRY